MRRLLITACLLALPALAQAQTTVTSVPTGVGSQDAWVADSGTKLTNVDDAVGAPDDDTTYIYQTASGQRQSFTFASLGVPGGSTITHVQIVARCKYIGTSSDLRLNIRSESTVNEDTDRNMTSGYVDYTRTMVTNPFTAASWTVNEVNTDGGTSNRFAEIELRSIAPNTAVRCTQVYASATYTAGGGAAVVRGALVGVLP